LLRDRLTARDLAWVSGAAPRPAQSYGAKTRYRQSDAPCTVHGAGADELDVSFVSPQWAVTPGQSVVLYDGAVCLGGGVIQ
jgi:tRNA-specific 2-thiouridylase